MYIVYHIQNGSVNIILYLPPKYRRKVFYGQKRYEIGQILRELCRWKQVNLLEAEACPDHIHILVEIPPKISVSNFMGANCQAKCNTFEK